MTRSFEETRALVTGGSRGIGLAIASALRDAGAEVTVCARGAEALVDAARLGCKTLVCDMTDPNAGRQLAASLEGLDLLIHNAGVQRELSFADGAPEDVAREVELNLIAPMRVTRDLLPLLQRSERAAIVHVTSVLAVAPKRSAPVYCASKAGLRSFTRALRAQLAPEIRVVELVPPLVKTAMTAGRDDGAVAPEVVAQALLDGLARGRDEIRVGKAKHFIALHRVVPGLAERMMLDR